MTEPIPSYECPISGARHEIIGPETRILRHEDGGFVVACDCGPESIDDAHEPPHPEQDNHLANIYANDPEPAQWLRIESAADGWYGGTRWKPLPEKGCTFGEFFVELRERAKNYAPSDSQVERRSDAVRTVECPDCGASPGSECQRASGHRVRESHKARVEAATEAEDDDLPAPSEQTTLPGVSGGV